MQSQLLLFQCVAQAHVKHLKRAAPCAIGARAVGSWMALALAVPDLVGRSSAV